MTSDSWADEPSGAKLTPGDSFFEVIEEAYRVFAYPKPTTTGVCERCCMDAKIEADFFKPEIRDLPLHCVQDWYSGAYDPDGIPKETWGYLLPRILEVLAAGAGLNVTAFEVGLSRFDTGNPNSWSSDEWAVLDRFQRMYLRRHIAPTQEMLDDVICLFGLAGWSLESLLEQAASSSDAELAQRLWHDWCEWTAPGMESVWITPFWDGVGGKAVFDFYTSREMYDRMVALAFGADTDPELAAKALAVAGVIEKSVPSGGS